MTTAKQYPISIENDEILLDVLLNLAHDTNTAWENIHPGIVCGGDDLLPTAATVFYKQYLLNNSFTLASFKDFTKHAIGVTEAFSLNDLGGKGFSAATAGSALKYLTQSFEQLKLDENQPLSFQSDGIYINNEKIADLENFLQEKNLQDFKSIMTLSNLEKKPSLEKLTDIGLESAFKAYDEHMSLIQSVENSFKLGVLSAEEIFVDLKDDSGNTIKADAFLPDSKNELNNKIKKELKPVTDESSKNIINLIEESKKKISNPLNQNQLEFLKKLQKNGQIDSLSQAIENCQKFGLTVLEKNLKEEFENISDVNNCCEKINHFINESKPKYNEINNFLRKLQAAPGEKAGRNYTSYIKTVNTLIERCDSILDSEKISNETKLDYENLKNDLIQEKNTLNSTLETNLADCEGDNFKILASQRQSAIYESLQRCTKLCDVKITYKKDENNISKNLLEKGACEGSRNYVIYVNKINSAIEHCDFVVNSDDTSATIRSDYTVLKDELIREKNTLNNTIKANLTHCNDDNIALKSISLNLCQSAIGESAQRCAKLYEDKIVNHPNHNSFADFLRKGNFIFKALVTLGEKILGKNSIRCNKDVAATHREELRSFGRNALFGEARQNSDAPAETAVVRPRSSSI